MNSKKYTDKINNLIITREAGLTPREPSISYEVYGYALSELHQKFEPKSVMITMIFQYILLIIFIKLCILIISFQDTQYRIDYIIDL